MAELGEPRLVWTDGPGDPGVRRVDLPDPLPEIGDDFDWQQRDFESFRLAMWSELQARFPERRRWTGGDVEAVLVEILAAHLDQLSDMADRVSAEAFLVSARRFPSFVSWLSFIGYDPCAERAAQGRPSLEALRELYRNEPQEMELDRRRGPASIRSQKRMVSAEGDGDDYALRLAEHPLVLRAYTTRSWNGAWLDLVATVAVSNGWRLDDRLVASGRALAPGGRERQLSDRRRREIDAFHERLELRKPSWQEEPMVREVLYGYVRRFRMAGQTVLLDDVSFVALVIGLCVTVSESCFQSEVRREIERVLGSGPDGFFRPGRLAAGQDVHLSDIYQSVMSVDGVADLTVTRFGKRRERPARGDVPDVIAMGPDELVCSRDRERLSLELHGGRLG